MGDMVWLEECLKQAKQMGASEVHLIEDRPVRYRVDGELHKGTGEKLPGSAIRDWLNDALTETHKAAYKENGELTFTVTKDGLFRMRVQAYRQSTGDAACLHLLPLCPPTTEELLIPEKICELLQQKRGLFLIAGASGAGKTTTMAALTGALLKESGKKITALEANTEYLYHIEEGNTSLLVQRETASHTKTMATGIKTALLQDSDVITVSELGGAESLEAAVRAVEMGRLVLAIVDAEDSFLAIETLLSYVDERNVAKMQQRLANALIGGMSQQLLPRENGTGRVAAYAYYTNTDGVKNLLREGKMGALASMLQSGERVEGMSMEDAVYELYMQSVISSEMAVYYAPDPKEMQRKVRLF